MGYDLEEAKRLILQAGKKLVEAGLVARTWGNISARISESQFLITPSGRPYETLTGEDLVIVNIEDMKYEGDKKPSSEKGVHSAIYKLRPDADFLIHTHQRFATAVSIDGKDIGGYGKPYTEVLGHLVPCAPYAISSTKMLMKKVQRTAERNPRCKAILLKGHGAVCIGESAEDAFAVAGMLEMVCRRKAAVRLGLSAMPDKLEAALGKNYLEFYEVVEIPTGPVSIVDVAEEFAAYSGKTVLAAQDMTLKYVSRAGANVPPLIDDMAQIAGTESPCLWYEELLDEKQVLMEKLENLSKDSSVIYIEDQGALCIADCEEEAQAVRMVAEKNALAELYSPFVRKPYLGHTDAWLQHFVYVKKYSKLKGK